LSIYSLQNYLKNEKTLCLKNFLFLSNAIFSNEGHVLIETGRTNL